MIVNNTIFDNEWEALQVWKGNGEVIANNIILSDAPGKTISFWKCEDKGMIVEHNLCVPKSPLQTDATSEGNPEYLPEKDFFNRPIAAQKNGLNRIVMKLPKPTKRVSPMNR